MMKTRGCLKEIAVKNKGKPETALKLHKFNDFKHLYHRISPMINSMKYVDSLLVIAFLFVYI